MIIGETPDDEQFRHMIETSLTEDWLGTVRPELAAQYGSELMGIVESRVRAAHVDADIRASTMGHFLAQNMGHQPTEEENETFMNRVNAQAMFHGDRPRQVPTGITAFDDVFHREDRLLANAHGDPDMEQDLVASLDAAERAAMSIFIKTVPGSLGA